MEPKLILILTAFLILPGCDLIKGGQSSSENAFGCIELQGGKTDASITFFETNLKSVCDINKPFSIFTSPKGAANNLDNENQQVCCHLAEHGKSRLARDSRALKE